ncbi:DsbA family protein [Thalassotalea ganghwensis]
MTLCNDELGCVIPNIVNTSSTSTTQNKIADIIFVTDPICSHCWAIEPMWRRLTLNYHIKVSYIHGGLLPGWEGFGDAGNGISKPTDVIPHWIHVAEYYKQPIDPSVWKNDPIDNSYILCKAAIAVRLLVPALESAFVRYLRERIFLYAQNVAKESDLLACVNAFNIDTKAFLATLASKEVAQIFKNEQQEMVAMGARGFPSLIFNGVNKAVIAGSQSYLHLEQALHHCFGDDIKLKELTDNEKINAYPSWTLREACEALQISESKAKQLLIEHGFDKTNIAGSEFWQKN